MASAGRALRTALVATSLVVGVAALGIGLAAAADVAETNYYHDVAVADEAHVDPGDDGRVYAFENLSSAGQTAFLGALNAGDGRYVTGADGRAPEFTYDWDLETAQVVRYDGESYVLWTNQEDVLGERIGLLFLPIGLISGGIGAVLWRRRSSRDGRE